MKCNRCNQDAPYLYEPWRLRRLAGLRTDEAVCSACLDDLYPRYYYKRASRALREALRLCKKGKRYRITVYQDWNPNGCRWPEPVIDVQIDRRSDATQILLGGRYAEALYPKALNYEEV